MHCPDSELPPVSEGSAATPTGAGVKGMRDLPLPPRALVWREPVPSGSSRSADRGRGRQMSRRDSLPKANALLRGSK